MFFFKSLFLFQIAVHQSNKNSRCLAGTTQTTTSDNLFTRMVLIQMQTTTQTTITIQQTVTTCPSPSSNMAATLTEMACLRTQPSQSSRTIWKILTRTPQSQTPTSAESRHQTCFLVPGRASSRCLLHPSSVVCCASSPGSWQSDMRSVHGCISQRDFSEWPRKTLSERSCSFTPAC